MFSISSNAKFIEGMTREDNNGVWPTTTGLLFVGNDSALRELPYYQIKYIHYFDDGTYRPYEYKGNIVEMAEACFSQLKAEIKQKEFVFGLFREYVEDYSEIVIRELLINALVHRDISRQQIIEIRKYDDGGYLEIESPGTFPEGVTVHNYLRKTNPRNPNVMDILREVGLAEKAGSGFDKIFTDLLKKGKQLPMPEETDTSVIFRVKAEVSMEKLIELSLLYENETNKSLKLDQLLVLREILLHKKVKLKDLEEQTDINGYRLHAVLQQLEQLELIESSGKTSGTSYLLHVSKRKSITDKVDYVLQKKQEKARQKEAILRYVDEIGKINNQEARALLKLSDKDSALVSKLFRSMQDVGDIEILEQKGNNCIYYGRKK